MATKPKNKDLEAKEVAEVPAGSFLKAAGVFFVELVKVAVLAGITIGAVRYFIFKPFIVHGASMAPNFSENEYLIIDEISYRFKEPARGDILVVHNPRRHGEFFLKRAIGMPGEHVVIKDGEVHINGTKLQEDYLPSREFTPGEVDVQLGPEDYYVMGDNRDASYDSRMFGAVKEDGIVGKVLLRGWPFDKAQRFGSPEYNI